MTYTIPNAQMNKSVKDFVYQIFEQNTNLTVKDILTLMLEGVPLYLVKAYQAWRIKISAEDILKYLTFFSQKNRLWHFVQTVSFRRLFAWNVKTYFLG